MLKRLLQLSPLEWSDLFRAQVALLRATWKLRHVKLGDLVSSASVANDSASAKEPAAAAANSGGMNALRARELATALERVAEHGPLRAQCLVRSMALKDMLQREGVPGSEIRVGVLRRGEELLAHAWVEVNGAVLGDQPSHVSRFVPIEGLRVNQ